MPKLQPVTRTRTCLACGAQYEYPIKDIRTSRHHCALCIDLPMPTRKAMERLSARIKKLEGIVEKLA
jgi:hypothetical protein